MIENSLSVEAVFLLLGITIIIGYLGSLFFDRTKIPDILWLIIFGLLIGPVFNLVSRQSFLEIANLLSAFALVLILFEAGLNIDFFQVVKNFSRSMLLAFLSMILTMIFISIISIFLFRFDLFTGLLLGAILGGTSSPVVLSLTNRINLRENVKTILNLESILTDPLVIIISIALMQYMTQSGLNSPIQGIISAFSIGAFLGGLGGLAWLFILDMLKGKPYDYMLTLAVLFLIYAISESYNGSGAIATLTFGIVLGNSLTFSKMLKFNKKFKIDKLLKIFQSELSFFIKSFFFVFLGIIFLPNEEFILLGLSLFLAIVLIRPLIVKIAMHRYKISKDERNFMSIIVPRGLAAAVLAQYPLTYGIKNAGIFSSVVLIVILLTILYTIIMARIFARKIS